MYTRGFVYPQHSLQPAFCYLHFGIGRHIGIEKDEDLVSSDVAQIP